MAVAAQLPRFFVGNITTNGAVRSDFIQYWNQITPENEGKWGQVEPTRDVYNWSGLDRAYNYAMQNISRSSSTPSFGVIRRRAGSTR